MIIDLNELEKGFHEVCENHKCMECPLNTHDYCFSNEDFSFMREIAKYLAEQKALAVLDKSKPTMSELVDFWEDR